MKYSNLCDKTTNLSLLQSSTQQRHITIFRQKNLIGEYFYGYMGLHNSQPLKQPDFYTYRCFINQNEIIVQDNNHQEIIKIKKSSYCSLFTVYYEKECYGSIYLKHFLVRTPRKMFVLLPNQKNTDIPHWQKNPMIDQLKYIIENKNYPSMSVLETKNPKFNKREGYYNSFEQENGISSVKNCIIRKNNKLVFELIRRKNNFGIIYSAPFSPAVAFACLVAQCWHKENRI